MLQACFAGKINHFLDLPPEVTGDFSRNFNKMRKSFMGSLVGSGDSLPSDLIGPWLNCQEVVLEFATVDPCNDTASSIILDDQFSPLDNAQDKKCLRFCDYIAILNSQRHNALMFQLFDISIYGNLGSAAQTLLSSFNQLCCKFGKKFIIISFWRDSLVFHIFRLMFQYFDGILKNLFGVQDHFKEYYC
ncbi:hypothetical protein GEMRC1_003767 [Eukaryota sp. GEM-RC1]